MHPHIAQVQAVEVVYKVIKRIKTGDERGRQYEARRGEGMQLNKRLHGEGTYGQEGRRKR